MPSKRFVGANYIPGLGTLLNAIWSCANQVLSYRSYYIVYSSSSGKSVHFSVQLEPGKQQSNIESTSIIRITLNSIKIGLDIYKTARAQRVPSFLFQICS